MTAGLGRDELARAASARRTEVSKNYLSSAAAQDILGLDADALRTWRRDRLLLAVWDEPENRWLYPDFQFNGKGRIEEVPKILEAFDRYYSHVWSNTWRIVEWFMTPHMLLNGERPAELMATRPNEVLKIAQIDLLQDPATVW